MISKEYKKNKISQLKESQLRKEVLIPLLVKMGFIDPIEYHHNNEKGKDIVCKEKDEKFNKYKYIAVIVKSGDITGSASSNSGMFTVINQLKQAINEPYKDIYNLKKVDIDECLIVTSGIIKPTSLDSIYGTLKCEHLDKAIRECIDINKLITLIDTYYKEYWHEEENKYESILNERNYLLNNIFKVIDLIIYNKNELRQIKDRISKGEVDFEIDSFYKTNMYIANTNYSKIQLDEVDSYYLNDIYNEYGNIPEAIIDIRKKAENILFDFDEIIEVLKDILIERDPLLLIEKCEELSGFVTGHDIGVSTRDIDNIDDIYCAITDYKERKEQLINSGLINSLSEFYKNLEDKLTSKLTEIILDVEDEEYWLGYKIRIVKSSNDNLFDIESSTYDYHQMLEKESENHFYIINKEYIDKENFIHIEFAINNYVSLSKSNKEEKIHKIVELYKDSLSKLLSNYEGTVYKL